MDFPSLGLNIFPYDEKKLKPYLKMAVQRLQIAGNKKSSACKHQKREIAKLLEDGKEEKVCFLKYYSLTIPCFIVYCVM